MKSICFLSDWHQILHVHDCSTIVELHVSHIYDDEDIEEPSQRYQLHLNGRP